MRNSLKIQFRKHKIETRHTELRSLFCCRATCCPEIKGPALYTVEPRNRNSNFGCEFLAGPGLRPGPVLSTEVIGRAVGHLSFRRGSGDPARLPSVVLRLLILRGRAPRSAPTPGRLGGQRPTGRQSPSLRAASPAGSQAVRVPTCTQAVRPSGTRAVSHTARRPSVPK